MGKRLYISLVFIFAFNLIADCQTVAGKEKKAFDPVIKIEMHLSAFGVESDDFPSIDAYINLIKGTSHCAKSFYNPVIKGSHYSLSRKEIKKIIELFNNTNLAKLKTKYTVDRTDQPTSTIIIYTKRAKLKIEDYGLEGEYPLIQLYRLVYKLNL